MSTTAVLNMNVAQQEVPQSFEMNQTTKLVMKGVPPLLTVTESETTKSIDKQELESLIQVAP